MQTTTTGYRDKAIEKLDDIIDLHRRLVAEEEDDYSYDDLCDLINEAGKDLMDHLWDYPR